MENLQKLQIHTCLLCVCFVTACASNSPRAGKLDTSHKASGSPSANNHAIESFALSDRLAWPDTSPIMPLVSAEKLYTFVAKDLPIHQAVKLFAQAYNINLIVSQDVVGMVNVEFHNLPFNQAMAALLNSNGYYWEEEDGLILVRSIETKIFSIDYIRLVRSGSGSSQAQVSSGSSSEGGGEAAGAMKIEQSDKVDFWEELDKQLKVIVSEKGRLVINRLAGTVQVTDQHKRVKEISKYITQLNQSIYRQVDISVKIVEVTLSDDFSLGIDWSRVGPVPPIPGHNQNFKIPYTVNQPVGGIPVLPPTLNFTGSRIGSDGSNKLTGILTALKEQGNVNIVSQPRIRTLNNQSALIKVGTDRTFFRKEKQTDTTSAVQSTVTTDVPQVVTEGIVLAITPQISLDGWITMDISPVVTRVSSISEVLDENGVVQSTAPNLEIRQTSSLVRTRNGETVVIGGLIQNQKIDSTRAIPWLHRIPILGNLFKGRYKSEVKRELIMFVTPRLIDDSSIFKNASN